VVQEIRNRHLLVPRAYERMNFEIIEKLASTPHAEVQHEIFGLLNETETPVIHENNYRRLLNNALNAAVLKRRSAEKQSETLKKTSGSSEKFKKTRNLVVNSLQRFNPKVQKQDRKAQRDALKAANFMQAEIKNHRSTLRQAFEDRPSTRTQLKILFEAIRTPPKSTIKTIRDNLLRRR